MHRRTLRLLSDPRLAAELEAAQGEDETGARQEIAELERRKAALRQKVEQAADHPDIDPMLAMQAISSYDRKLRQLRSQLATDRDHHRLERVMGISPESRAAEPVEVRAAVINRLWHVVTLPAKKGPGFDPSSVRLWRRSVVRR